MKTCLFCGALLPDAARFCKNCGKGVAASITDYQASSGKTPEGRRCTKCGTFLSQTARFCRGCGTAALSENKTAAAQTLIRKAEHTSVNMVTEAARQTVETVMASSSPGDCILGISTPPDVLKNVADQGSSAIAVLSPFKVLIDGLISAVKGIGAAGKNKKALFTAIVFAVGWLVLTLLPALGIYVPTWLNFLTFARGGLSGGIAGFAGGVFGKGLIVSTVMGIVSGIGQSKGEKRTKMTGQRMNPPNGLGLTLTGLGLALVLFNFMTGNNSPQNSMVGIAAAVAAIRSQDQNGFFRQLAVSLSARLSRTSLPSNAQTGRLTAGFAAGFALGVPLSLLWVPWVCYLLGLLACVVGWVLSRTAKTKTASLKGHSVNH